jgi:hypothetical protein
MIWLRNVLDAELFSRDLRRVLIEYDAILSDWRCEIQRLEHAFGLDFHLDRVSIISQVNEFLEVGLRHFESRSQEVDDDLKRFSMEVFEAIRIGDSEFLDAARVRFTNLVQEEADWIKKLNDVLDVSETQKSMLINKLNRAACDLILSRNEVADLSIKLAEQSQILSNIQASRTWRWTSWLRKNFTLDKSNFL